MNILPIIAAAEEELCDIFEMLHAHPEIGFEEHKTSQIVQNVYGRLALTMCILGLAISGWWGCCTARGAATGALDCALIWMRCLFMKTPG